MNIALFVVAILIIVMVHESGHFIAAKKLGFKATKFFVGFGPTLWSFHKGETEYGIKALPLGGFVKIIGMNPYEEVAREDLPRSYPNKPRWQRAIVLLAGPATHWVLAFLVLTITLMTFGIPTAQASNKVAQVSVTVDGTKTPAASAGLLPGDRIVAVGGKRTDSWTEIRAYIRAHGGREGTFDIERDGDSRSISVTLGRAIVDKDGRAVALALPGQSLRPLKDGEEIVGFLGVEPSPIYERFGFFRALGASGKHVGAVTTGSIRQIGGVFAPVFNGELLDAVRGRGERPQGVGLVGASRIASQTLDRGNWFGFLELMVLLTIFLGIMNLLPLPPLDGGHLAVVAYESVTKKSVDIRRLIPIAAAVISFFLILFVAFLYLDIVDPIRLPL